MKFSLSWLKTHLETDASVDDITSTLTRIGLELEGVENRGAAIASFRIAHVIEAAPFRSEERRVGKECLSVCRSRWSPYH